MTIESPHPFAERFLLYADGGGGKTETAVNIASHVAGRFWVIESDYSAAWDRAIALGYPDVADRCEVTAVDDWQSCITELTRVVQEGDPDQDWIVVDSASPITYEWVQDWVLDQIYGDDLASVLIETRRNARPANGKSAGDIFKGQKLELMNWDLVKKEYRKFWRTIQSWKGHMILTAEAKQIGYWDKDDADVQKTYAQIGYYPAGQQTVRHSMSTTLYLAHPKTGRWTMTTVKDRGREEMDREDVEDFGRDYLQTVAGWTRVKKSKAQLMAEMED
jgi:hypothetical protein